MRTTNPVRYNWLANVFAFLLPALLAMGCSTTPPPKAQESAMQPQQQAAIAKPVAVATSSSGSSLEAHREGKIPALGPLKDIYFAGSEIATIGLSSKMPRRLDADGAIGNGMRVII